jgi:hypothetical protein
MSALTVDIVKRLGGAYSLDHLVSLTAQNQDLVNVDVLAGCVWLQWLDLSGNQLTHVGTWLQSLPCLLTFDLSNNRLTDLDVFRSASALPLRTLRLNGNRELKLQHVAALADCAKLEVLDLAGCAVAMDLVTYADTVGKVLPQLLCVDNRWLGGAGRQCEEITVALSVPLSPLQSPSQPDSIQGNFALDSKALAAAMAACDACVTRFIATLSTP